MSVAADPTSDLSEPAARPWRGRAVILARCVAAGASIALAIPPFGWWPLAILGLAQWDLLLADQPAKARFRRSWLVAATWLFPMMLWMFDLTPPGYVVACVSYAGFFALLTVAVPGDDPTARRIALPAAVALGELWRWTWPFEGVPLATLAQSQGDAPMAQAARVVNAIGVSALVAVAGVAVSAAFRRRLRPALVGAAIVVGLTLAGVVAPRGTTTDDPPVRVAIVQGGGEQRTPFASNEKEVFDRHLSATRLIQKPVDFILWPENVVAVDGKLPGSEQDERLAELAREMGAPLLVGITEDDTDTTFLNASVVYLPDGTIGDRYDKARRVPFGEWVPFRNLLVPLVGEGGLPRRDAVPGLEPAVVDTPAGPMGVVISWEVFFTDRAADATRNGGVILTNPTNGSSYWLTQVQTQQIASSRLRAIETGRWVLQAAPTGFSAIVDPSGSVIDCTKIDEGGVASTGRCRTDVSEVKVLQASIPRRTGDTLAVRLGPWPVLLGSIGALLGANLFARRRRSEVRRAGQVVAEGSGSEGSEGSEGSG